MKTRNHAVPAVYILLAREGRLLVARRANTGYQDGTYHVPAGHVEEGELPKEALVREAYEELGLTVEPEDLQLLHVAYRPKHDETGDRVDFYFGCTRWDGDVVNREPHKCDDLRWVSPDELPENTAPHIRDAIESTLGGVFFREVSRDFLRAHDLYRL